MSPFNQPNTSQVCQRQSTNESQTMKRIIRIAGFILLCLAAAMKPARSAEPIYSLDLLQDHPYRFVPAYGHASQNPGSPKWFVPGYGYRIPGFGYSSPVTSYTDYYQFGALKPGFYNPNQQLFLSNSYGAPWYIPGSTTNVTNSWPQW